jgi:hypothetical protein
MLGELQTSPQIRQCCQEYAGKIDPQTALERACTLIEQLG